MINHELQGGIEKRIERAAAKEHFMQTIVPLREGHLALLRST
jgi:hypothetical protein